MTDSIQSSPRAQLPATYGEVMAVLDPDLLPEELGTLYRTHKDVRDWVGLWERVSRAEKVSAWSSWSELERERFESGDWRGFSRLRGYTEEEVSEFAGYLDLTARLDSEFGENFCWDLSGALGELVRTEAMDRVHELVDLEVTEKLGQNVVAAG